MTYQHEIFNVSRHFLDISQALTCHIDLVNIPEQNVPGGCGLSGSYIPDYDSLESTTTSQLDDLIKVQQ